MLQEKFLSNPKINPLIDQWDVSDISSQFLDLVCCFNPEEKYLIAAPNGRFILRSTEPIAGHANLQCNPVEKGMSSVKANKLVP